MLTGYYHGGAGLAVIGLVSDIGQNVLQSSIKTESGSSYIYFQIFLLVALLEKALIKNTSQ